MSMFQRTTVATPADIPRETLDGWQKIPADAAVTLQLTREDFDGLLAGIRQLALSQGHFMRAFQSLQNAEPQTAETEWHRAVSLHNAASHNLNYFATALMTKSVRDE